MIHVADYHFLADLLLAHSGLSLGSGKEYLIESRLNPLARELGVPSLAALLQRLRATPDRSVVRAVCEAMTTNESFFFRDTSPFRTLREVILPRLIEARRSVRHLRIWSCAASTGQEPYSVAMILAEMGDALRGWEVEILATDYSRPALERARAGLYNQFEVQRGLPPELLDRYFAREGSDWRLAEPIRRMVHFRDANLLDPFDTVGRYDLVFCRNVLIYFDTPTKADVLDRLSRVLAPDGFLFLGGSETILGVSDRVERIGDLPTVAYRARP